MDALALAEEHKLSQIRASVTTQRAVDAALVRYLDPRRLDDTFPRYLAAAIKVTSAGHATSAKMAAAYYGEAKTLEGLKPLDAELTRELLALEPLDLETMAKSLRVLGPVTVKTYIAQGRPPDDAMRLARAKTAGAVMRYALSGGRSYLTGAPRHDRDALGWSRLSDGDPCDWCAMLVSRGPVYKEATVRFSAHDRCGCGAKPYFRGTEDDGWTPAARELRRIWDDPATDEAGHPLSWAAKLAAAKASA